MAPEYLKLSTAVMIGVPSISLAAASLLFAMLWHQKGNSLWLALSGFALALSVLTKLFTGSLAPIFLIGMTASAYFHGKQDGLSWKMLRPALIWSLCFGSLTILLGLLLIGPQNLLSIISPHVAAPTTDWLQGPGYDINTRLQAAVPLLVLAFLGALLSIYRRNWLSLYPLAWSLLAYILFSFYSPVFYHHQLLVTIPATMLAAAAVGEGILSVLRLRRASDVIRLQTLLGVGALLGFVFVSLHYLPTLDKELRNKPRLTDISLKASPARLRVLRTMSAYVDQTNWIMTDVPIYAFRVQRPVPPSLATFSSKRLATGALTEEDILIALREYRPEQVLMARFEIPAVEAYLQENYTLILDVEYFRLFLRNDLKPLPE
jgi:4-amino-4-deoxy-L-arabinose transferase-like glycosyltransferase